MLPVGAGEQRATGCLKMWRNEIMAEKYRSVNGAWPEGTNDGRSLKPTPQEALAGARRLYRIAMGRPFRGKMTLTSGRNRTWIRRGVFKVNPDEDGTRFHQEPDGERRKGGGWHEIVHAISHYAARKLYDEAHGPRHAFIERELIKAVCNKGWLDGKLKRPETIKPKPDLKAIKHQRVQERLAVWERKKKRAETALK